MANTQKYLNHLLQNAGITPACSEEERAASEVVANIFKDHGFDPEVQEFSASSKPDLLYAVLGIAAFVGAVLMGIAGAIGVIGFLLAIAAGVLFYLARTGRIDASRFGSNGLSQNVIAYHKASGPLASPRNRPVVVVAHIDSPRTDLFSQLPYASYLPMVVKLLPYAFAIPAAASVARLLPLPGAVKVVLWLASIVAALVPLAYAVGIVANRFVLPYASGAIGNRSSVASLLGVMDAVSPYRGENEFPRDKPFARYMAEQRRAADEAMRSAQAGPAAPAGVKVPRAAVAGQEARPAAAPDEATATAGAAPSPADEPAVDFPAVSVDAPVAAPASATASIAPLSPEGAVPAAAAPAVSTTVPASSATESNDGSGAAAGETASFGVDSIDRSESADGNPAAHDVDPHATGVIDAEDLEGSTKPLGDERAPVSGGASVSAPEPEQRSDEPADDGADVAGDAGDIVAVPNQEPEHDRSGDVAEAADEVHELVEEPASPVNDEGNYRYGVDELRSLGMVSPQCDISYEEDAARRPRPVTASAKSGQDLPGDGGTGSLGSTNRSSAAQVEAPKQGDSSAPKSDATGVLPFDAADDREHEGEKPANGSSSARRAFPDYSRSGSFGVDDRGTSDTTDQTAAVEDAAADVASDDEAASHAGVQPPVPVAVDGGVYPSSDEDYTAPTVLNSIAEKFEELSEKVSGFFKGLANRNQDSYGDEDDSWADEDAADASVDQAREQTRESLDDVPSTDSVATSSRNEAFEPSKTIGSMPALDAMSGTGTFLAQSDADKTRQETSTSLFSTSERPGGTQALPVSSATGKDSEDGSSTASDATDSSEQRGDAPHIVETVDSLMEEISSKVSSARSTTQGESASVSDTDATRSQPAVPPSAAPSPSMPSAPVPITPANPLAGASRPDIPNVSLPAHPRQIPPSVPDMSHLQQIPASRTGLFDLPDPSVAPVDPFTASVPPASTRGFAVVDTSAPFAAQQVPDDQPAEASTSDGAGRPAPQVDESPSRQVPQDSRADVRESAKKEKPGRRGLFGGLFSKKKQEESMSDWLGVGDDFDAKRSGSDIGSWDNFEDDDDGWKGGATSTGNATEEELRDSITSMGDDELLGHDIWFVVTGASDCDNAGIKAFLNEHRSKLRGVFLINLESIGAGDLCMLATEGKKRVLKGDRRIMKLVSRVSSDFHIPFASVDMPYVETDAYAAMNMSLRALTIAGVDGPRFACTKTLEDQPYNVDDRNVAATADVVTEVIRRS